MGVCPSCSWRIAQRYRERFLSEHAKRVEASIAAQNEAFERQRERERASSLPPSSIPVQPPGTSWVYYVRVGDAIKIGYSGSLVARMSSLRVDRSCDVLAIEPGGQRVEAARHTQFAHLRIKARWENFRPVDDLTAHIDSLRAEHGIPAWLNPPPRHRGKSGPVTIQRTGEATC